MTNFETATNITGMGDAAAKKRTRKRIEPVKAWRAMQALLADKEDTGQVFKIIDALSGGADERMYRRFMTSESGRRIVGENRDLITVLNNRDYLKSLPEGTLGRTYHDFMAEENLTADGLVAASEEAPYRQELNASEKIFSDRMRDSHDLWHVTTGYGRDGLGELSLLAFYYAQDRNRGIGFIVLMGAYTSAKDAPKSGIWKAVREGYRLGKKARWLPAADWEALLEKPVSEVRALLGVEEPAFYREIEPVTTAIENRLIAEEQMKAA